MRVIAGEAHGRPIAAPRGMETRPATARVRASIFSRIASRRALTDTRVLDLFAGSGSLGIEALSRGAAAAVFVDSSREAAATIVHNLRQFGLEGRGRVIVSDAARALDELGNQGDRFDLVFVDPPFKRDSSAEVLATLARHDLINSHGIVIVRQFHRAPLLQVAEFECANQATVGDHRIAFYRRVTTAAARDETEHAE